MTAEYCSAADVASFMRISITASSEPSIADVESIIEQIQDTIDAHTHHAWRVARITDEIYNFDGFPRQFERFGDWSDRARIYFKHRSIRQVVPGVHKIELWDGGNWTDIVSTCEEGRNNEYWIDYNRGILHFANRFPWRIRHSIRMTYDYGDSTVHGDIRRACKMLTAAEILQGEDYTVLLPEGSSNIPQQVKSEKWEEKAYNLLDKHVELTSW